MTRRTWFAGRGAPPRERVGGAETPRATLDRPGLDPRQSDLNRPFSRSELDRTTARGLSYEGVGPLFPREAIMRHPQVPRAFVLALVLTIISATAALAEAQAASSPGVLRLATTTSTADSGLSVSYTHLRAHETRHDLVC